MHFKSLVLATVSGFGLVSVYLISMEHDDMLQNIPMGQPLQWTSCQPASCTFRVCNASGVATLLDRLHGDNCSLRTRHKRASFTDTMSADNMGSSVVMFPPSNYTEPSSCQDWFFGTNAQHSGGGIVYVHGYLAQRRPTDGISKAVTYYGKPYTAPRRYLVIYAAATQDEYRRAVADFTLRRIRDTLPGAFIIAVETSADGRIDQADVVLEAGFVSPDTFYDSAAMQEGMLEAYRLFGPELDGFYGLLILNDSLIGPITEGLAEVLPAFPDSQPVVIGAAVWAQILISGSGILANRAAFTAPAFANFWRFMRFPCGKWGSMMLWEGAMRLSLVADTGSVCMALTNDIMALNAHPDYWGALPFYKHKNSGDPDAVLRFVANFTPGRPMPPVQKCQV